LLFLRIVAFPPRWVYGRFGEVLFLGSRFPKGSVAFLVMALARPPMSYLRGACPPGLTELNSTGPFLLVNTFVPSLHISADFEPLCSTRAGFVSPPRSAQDDLTSENAAITSLNPLPPEVGRCAPLPKVLLTFMFRSNFVFCRKGPFNRLAPQPFALPPFF